MHFNILLSHIWVRSNESYKFDIINTSISYYKENYNCNIILCGHGCELPQSIKDKCKYTYWPSEIDERQIGRGHPRMVLEGLEYILSLSVAPILKMRAQDVLFVDLSEIYYKWKQNKKPLIISEQTSIKNKLIGDLFMFGDFEYMRNLWMSHKWDYTKDGLNNLYKNFEILEGHNRFQERMHFISVEDLKWVDLETNWLTLQNNSKDIIQNKFIHKKEYFWGYNKYNWYYQT